MTDLVRILVFPVNIVCTGSCHGAVFFALWFAYLVFSHRKLMAGLVSFWCSCVRYVVGGEVSYAHHVLRCASGNCL